MPAALNRWALLAAVSLAAGSTAAQTVQRCEGADGKITYSNESCPAGTRAVRNIDVPEAPKASDQKAARERAARDTEAAQALEKRRRDEEAKAVEERAAQRKQAEKQAENKQRECRKLEQRVRAARQDLDKTPLNKRDAAEKKLRAAQDAYDLDCAGR
jgi:hypothetical protein